MDRKRPFGSSGVLASLYISPRTYAFFVCPRCLRELYFTLAGETCPLEFGGAECGALITAEHYVQGEMPDARGGVIDFRSRSPLFPPPADGRATRQQRRRGGRRRSGKRHGTGAARVRVATSPVAAGV